MKRIQYLNESLQLIDLFEARRNSDQNPKISAYEALKPYKDDPNVFISFTEIDKLGINPKSNFVTPLGIYCYPLKETWKKYSVDQKKSIGKAVPFAGKRPYVWLIRKKSSINFINDLYTDYTFKDYDNDIKLLIEDIKNNPSDYKELKFSYSSKLKKASEFFSFQIYIKDLFSKWAEEANQTSIVSKTWNITRNLADFRNSSRSESAIQWNVILRDVLGYDGVADKSGKGIIHPSEPLQAVFFHKRAFEVVGEFLNKDYETTNFPNWIKKAKTKGFIFKTEFSKNKKLIVGYGGIWLDGTWEGNIWEDGNWKKGIWKKGRWEDGFWHSGTWERGIWESGTWYNGIWKKGTWKNGTWENGSWYSGTWKDGIWESGTWYNGIWKNGDWEEGKWLDGTWEDGTWIEGWIFDPNKIGNFLPDWEWNGEYVKSLINPKDYFN